MLDRIAAAKSVTLPAKRPTQSKDAMEDGEDGEDGDGDEEEEQSDDDEEARAEAGTGVGDADAAAAAPAAGSGLQTFVYSATLTLPQALRRRLQKRADLLCVACAIHSSLLAFSNP